MLPPANRLTRSADFESAVRGGRRVRSGAVVLHLAGSSSTVAGAADRRVGFVVSKAVGGSVVRHRVVRRLRAVVGSRLDAVPAGTDVVVRALPAAGTATSAALCADFERALQRLGRS